MTINGTLTVRHNYGSTKTAEEQANNVSLYGVHKKQ